MANTAGGARRRGGQPGNTNALKHGFYSKHFKGVEAADLEEMGQEADLSSEIAMMRVIIRRVFEHADGCQDLESWSDVLGSLGAASTRLAGLLRVQQVLSGGGGDAILDALSQALKDVGGIGGK